MQEFLRIPVEASAHAAEIDHMTAIIHWLMFALFVGWGAFFTYVLFRFRRSKQSKAQYAGVKTHASSYLEVAVAVIEGVLIIGFAVPLWAKRVNAFPPEKDATVVRVVAEQFAWNVHYPGTDGVFGRTDIKLITAANPLGLDRTDPYANDDITTINQLNLPVGKPVVLYLSSKDVIHSFGVTYLRVKQDAIPGERIPLWFTPTKTNDELQEELAGPFGIDPQTINVERAPYRFAAKDYMTRSGELIVKRGELLSEEMVPNLKEAGLSDVEVTKPDLATLVAMREYVDQEGTVVLRKGDRLSDDAVLRLLSMGVHEILTAPDTPLEIACAQLCGLGHFRMRGFITIQTPEDYKTWFDDETAYAREQFAVPENQ